MLRRFIGLAAAVLAGALLAAWGGPAGLPASSGTSASAVTALDLTGKAIDPLEAAGGKVLVLIFVRTDCPIANRYAPTIKALSQKYAGAAVMMLVYPDKSETPQNIEKHLQEYGYRLAALQDKQLSLVKLSKVEITPEVGVFNGKGELIYHGRIDNWYKEFGRARPAPTTHELDEAVQAAVNGSQAVPASVGGVGCYISDLK
ncbi:MAG TPA: redoxin family protein [Candidatus Angelobacter sp.]|nr:redoxin family protein [Candidatus Angelobacter sp.]